MKHFRHALLLLALTTTAIASDDESPEYRFIAAARSSELTRSADAPDPGDFLNWSRSHGNAMSNRYSAHSQIHAGNVRDLEIAWVYKSEYSASIQANPIFVDGKVIFPIPRGYVVALNAASGEEIWRHHAPGQPAMRGLTYWPGDKDTEARLFFPAGNSLRALSLEGKPVLEFGDAGEASTSKSLVAPAIALDTIIYPVYGNASVQGIDVRTGKIKWETPLLKKLPPDELADDSTFGGGNPWGGMAIDVVRGIAFIATGNPIPAFVGITRPGDNAHANSLLAIDVRDGRILWSFQEIPHDIWDKDIPAAPILTQIRRGGELIDVVASVTKHGNTILLDRVSGKPIYPWRLRKAPRSQLPGEVTAEYQPDVELPEPLSKQEFGENDLTNLGKKNHAWVYEIFKTVNSGFFPPFADGKDTVYFGLRGGAEWPGGAVDPFTNTLYVASNDVPWRMRVINVAGLDQMQFSDTPQRRHYLEHCSACHGQGLQGVGINPALYGVELTRDEAFVRDIVYNGQRMMPGFKKLPPETLESILHYVQTFRNEFDDQKRAVERTVPPQFHFTGWRVFRDQEGYPANKPPWGWLNALDLNTGRITWKVPLGTDRELEKRGLIDVGTENLAGPILTGGGLVFIAGTMDRMIRAFDKNTGKELWRHELPFVGSAPPLVYMMNGRQYLMVPATGGALGSPTGNAFIAFALPEK